jgi:hypothetical protein
VRKAKPSNFDKDIPRGMEGKFAASRLASPNPLSDPTKTSSHVTAVFQGLAATVKAHEAYGGLDWKAKGKREFKMLKPDLRPSQIDEQVRGYRTVPTSKAFVDVISDMQRPKFRPVNTCPLQRKLEGENPAIAKKAQDPVKYMEHVLKATNSSYIEEAYNTPNVYQNYWQRCDGINACSDTENSARLYNKDYQPPTINTDYSYITPLTPALMRRELNYAKLATCDLHILFKKKIANPEILRCPRCDHPTRRQTLSRSAGVDSHTRLRSSRSTSLAQNTPNPSRLLFPWRRT